MAADLLIRRVGAAIVVTLLVAWPTAAADADPFAAHGRLRVSKSGTHLEHADGTPFFFLADTCWTGPALSSVDDWQTYLKDRKAKRFTAIQFNAVSPWRAAPTDADGQTAYTVADGKLLPNETFFRRLDARLKAVNDAGLLAVPVLAWANKKGDAGTDLTEDQLVTLIKFEVARYRERHCLFILAGDNKYTPESAARWKRIGRAVFADMPDALVTTHPTGMNWPWNGWDDETWLKVLGYQSGHGDSDKTWEWIVKGPPAEYGKQTAWTRPAINLEPPYEGHNGYQSKKPHSAYNVRRATYWSLLVAPPAGVTYGGHGVWSWHTKPGKGPTDHESTGVAKVWREALDLPGATEMGHVRTLFESVPWTELRPARNLIVQTKGADEVGKFVACAATPDRKVVVIYMPAGARASMVPKATTPSYSDVWFNPRTGRTNASKDFEPSETDDWVLVVRQ